MTRSRWLRRARQAVLARLDARPLTRRWTQCVAGLVARRRGADPALVADATAEDLPLDRSLQGLLWATALGGGAPLPNHFDPGDHLQTPERRRRAADALQSSGDGHDDRLLRQRIGVDDDLPVDDMLRLVEGDLTSRIAARATRPKRGEGLDRDLQLELVLDIQTRLQTVGVRPFLMSGTLLGVIREGHFMDHDHDIDLGLLPGDDPAPVAAELERSGHYRVERLGRRIVATHRTGTSVDLFEHWLDQGQLWHATLIHEWWNTPFGIRPHEVDGAETWIPDDPETYLTENYGDWSRPVAFYDISFDTPNRRYRHDLPAVRYLYTRCLRALETNDRWLLESAARELRDAFGIDVTSNLAASPLVAAAGSSRPDPSGDDATGICER